MAKNRKPKKHKHGGSVAPPDQGAKALEDLDRIVRTLDALATAAAGPVWGDAQHALLKTAADRRQVMTVIMSRDLAALRLLVDQVAGRATPEDGVAATAGPGGPEETAPSREFDHEELKRAMRAFRKRLKLARLDDESKLSVRPMTGGKHSEIRSIIPPREYERDIWRELARQGQLRDIGQGFYELGDEPPVRD